MVKMVTTLNVASREIPQKRDFSRHEKWTLLVSNPMIFRKNTPKMGYFPGTGVGLDPIFGV
jgi:hypothetical protein